MPDAHAENDASPLTSSAPPSLAEVAEHLHGRITKFLDEKPVSETIRNVQEATRISLRCLEEALDKYSLSELSLSYNGGKDCLVLLILYLCALHTKAQTSGTKLQSVYIRSAHPFPEVENFVTATAKTYSLDVQTYTAPMKAAFASYLHDNPNVQAIFVGTRRTDPHGASLTHFDPTDRGWPAFMRIHPVIDWHYVEIWAFIRHLKIPYCDLYDQGYTSLGGTTDTHPNPALRREVTNGATGGKEFEYKPAYELVEDYEERLGRDDIKTPSKS